MSDEEAPDLSTIISNIYIDSLDIGVNSAKCLHELRITVSKIDPKLGDELLNGPFATAMDRLLSTLEVMQKRYVK